MAAKTKAKKSGKTGSTKTRSAKTPSAKTRSSKPRRGKRKPTPPDRISRKAAIPPAFRFNAAQTVQIQFAGQKKPERFRVDDMVEASLVTLSGQTKRCYQYRLVSNDVTKPDGSDRYVWFFDPAPVGTVDSVDPSLWRPSTAGTFEGREVLRECSGNFSTRSVTSYDGSGSRHIVRLDGTSGYGMTFDLNGTREVCESLPVSIRKDDVLVVSEQPAQPAVRNRRAAWRGL